MVPDLKFLVGDMVDSGDDSKNVSEKKEGLCDFVFSLRSCSCFPGNRFGGIAADTVRSSRNKLNGSWGTPYHETIVELH